MADMRNNELNDEMMAQANGGTANPMGDVATITGIVMFDPYPDDSLNESIWDSCQENGYQVYEVNDGRIVIADSSKPAYSIGDQVILNRIRGAYGWEIDGVIDGPVVMQ